MLLLIILVLCDVAQACSPGGVGPQLPRLTQYPAAWTSPTTRPSKPSSAPAHLTQVTTPRPGTNANADNFSIDLFLEAPINSTEKQGLQGNAQFAIIKAMTKARLDVNYGDIKVGDWEVFKTYVITVSAYFKGTCHDITVNMHIIKRELKSTVQKAEKIKFNCGNVHFSDSL